MAWGETGCTVAQTKESAASVLFSVSGETTIRQIETVSTTETRGLTEANAKGRVTAPTHSADYAETTWYKTVGGVTHKIVVKTGTETRHSAKRADESGQWAYTKTETAYSCNMSAQALTGAGWATSAAGGALTAAGVEVPVSQDKTSAYEWGTNTPICSTVTTTVAEYRFLTEAGKNAKLALASSGARVRAHVRTGVAVSGWCNFLDGTDVAVSARHVSAEEGWTATVTTKVYGFSGDGWELS